jgi:hypothetical protein
VLRTVAVEEGEHCTAAGEALRTAVDVVHRIAAVVEHHTAVEEERRTGWRVVHHNWQEAVVPIDLAEERHTVPAVGHTAAVVVERHSSVEVEEPPNHLVVVEVEAHRILPLAGVEVVGYWCCGD